MTVIQKGTGFNVGHDFYRAPFDMPIEIDAKAYAPAGHAIGTVAGIPNASVSFMRNPKIQVCVQKRFLAEVE